MKVLLIHLEKIHEIFNNALLSEEERDRKAEKERKNADEKSIGRV